MTVEEPRWWKYVLLEDVNGVGIVKGFVEGTPQDIIDEYNAEMKAAKRRRRNRRSDEMILL